MPAQTDQHWEHFLQLLWQKNTVHLDVDLIVCEATEIATLSHQTSNAVQKVFRIAGQRDNVGRTALRVLRLCLP
eukprot:169654-Prymnesium_polylepis.1